MSSTGPAPTREHSTSTRRARVRVRRPEAPAPVSPVLYGLFLEDINFAADGGLNANLVNNYTFDGAYLDRSNGYSQLGAVMFKKKARAMYDPLRHWSATSRLESRVGDGPAPGAQYARLGVEGAAELVNHGYPGDDGASMGCRAGVGHEFSALVRADRFDGDMTVALVSADGVVVAEASLEAPSDGWQQVQAVLTPDRTALCSLRISATGAGDLDLDEVSLVAQDHWKAGDPRWTQGRLRRDLVEALAELKPGFMRFPGGCIVEGVGDGNQYDWRDTVGPLVHRRSKYSLWAEGRRDGDYSQSNQVGFYEYFLLCEDLGMEPVPVVWAGLSCQFRSSECTSATSPEFQDVVQSALDLIDWATGDPATSRWAALRAEAGHPEPFELNYLGIGNENHGHEYLANFDRIKAAVDERRPGMRLVLASGAWPKGEAFDLSHAHAADTERVIVDEHAYSTPRWFLDQSTRYDSYPRRASRVMVGEYAAYPVKSPLAIVGRYVTNRWRSAVAEAAFLTGAERNADVVEMTCYAPLFAHVDAKQWRHNLIEFSALTVQPTVNYEVQRLFGEVVGTETRQVEVAGTSDVRAAATADDGTTVIKLVNTARHATRVVLTIDDIAAGGQADVTQLVAGADERSVISLDRASTPVRRNSSRVDIRDGSLSITLPPYSVTRVEAQAA
ncbi:MAG: hypothetical protein HGA44_09565 [Cellulomonadaceae bacterium]|nr:hypothetical protein [Cellulomonadaceae bacterium]